MRHVLNAQDLGKRHRTRRLEALEALLEACPRGRIGSPKELVSALGLAVRWGVHPSSAYRVLERLRKFKTVDRSGEGVKAGYWITEKGGKRLEWLRARREEEEKRIRRKK